MLLAALALASTLGFDAPAEWTSKPSSSSMRVAVWELPGEAGAAELVIFSFGVIAAVAAVVEGGTGPWYIRVLGSEATMAKWEASVEDFLSSLRLE